MLHTDAASLRNHYTCLGECIKQRLTERPDCVPVVVISSPSVLLQAANQLMSSILKGTHTQLLDAFRSHVYQFIVDLGLFVPPEPTYTSTKADTSNRETRTRSAASRFITKNKGDSASNQPQFNLDESIVDCLTKLDVLSYYQEIVQLAEGLALTRSIVPSMTGVMTARLEATFISNTELITTQIVTRFLREQCQVQPIFIDARELLQAEKPLGQQSETVHYLYASCGINDNAKLQHKLIQVLNQEKQSGQSPVQSQHDRTQSDLSEDMDNMTIREAAEHEEVDRNEPGSPANRFLFFVTQAQTAADRQGDTVLLGSGGSDMSAAYIAAALSAFRMELWTNSSLGFFTSDPTQIPSARLILHTDYNEAQELVTMYSNDAVFHPRCLDPLRERNTPLHIFAIAYKDVAGTVIRSSASKATVRAVDSKSSGQVKAIYSKRGTTVLSMESVGMWQQVGFLAEVFSAFKRHGLSVDLVSTSETNVTVTLDSPEHITGTRRQRSPLQQLLRDLEGLCTVDVIQPCVCVSLIGNGLRNIFHELTPSLNILSGQEIYLVSQSASGLNLTFVVKEQETTDLVPLLYESIFNGKEHKWAPEDFGRTFQQLSLTEINNKSVTVTVPAVEPVIVPWWKHKRSQLLDLVSTEQSPLYVYDTESIQKALDSLKAVTAVDKMFFAIKANPHKSILKLVHEAGLGFECVSQDELELIIELFPDLSHLEPFVNSRLLFTPNFADIREYEFAFLHGIMVTVDNLSLLEVHPDVFRNKSILLRFDSGTGLGHHDKVRTGGYNSKFGISIKDVEAVATLCTGLNITVRGLHIHNGSGVMDVVSWSETALLLAKVAESFPTVTALNLGGGLGVPYKPTELPLDLDCLSDLLKRVKTVLPKMELWMEPGRYIVAESGVLLATVTQIKEKDGKVFVGVDTGMNSLIRPSLYGSYHHIVNLSSESDVDSTDGSLTTITADIVGPICESGDVLGTNRVLNQVSVGSVLLIATTGAYGHCMGSCYNNRKPARELMI
eukprot:GILJ01005883.1.p1 GENE.GILJ01005883.1~~GILJ01005883.1.p1  ORF type:complete len:1064 (-),score=180.85 GILJ01005883.1:1620-4652(-)